jgi:hypothetical protein
MKANLQIRIVQLSDEKVGGGEVLEVHAELCTEIVDPQTSRVPNPVAVDSDVLAIMAVGPRIFEQHGSSGAKVQL